MSHPQIHITPEMERSLGQSIIEAIIKGNLVNAECANEKWHGCLIIWSANAAEQLGQQIIEMLRTCTFESEEAVKGGERA